MSGAAEKVITDGRVNLETFAVYAMVNDELDSIVDCFNSYPENKGQLQVTAPSAASTNCFSLQERRL